MKLRAAVEDIVIVKTLAAPALDMSVRDVVTVLMIVPDLIARIVQVEVEQRELRHALGATTASSSTFETPAQYAKRVGISVAAAHKAIRREELRQRAGHAPRFHIVRKGRRIGVVRAQ